MDGRSRFVVSAVLVTIVTALTMGTPVASATYPAGVGPMSVVFGDDFDGTSLDTSKWSPNWDWQNGEMTGNCVSPNNASVSGGQLHLRVTPVASTCASGTVVRNNTAGLVSTNGHFVYQYGYVEWSARIPGPPGCSSSCPVLGLPQLWSMPPGHDFEIDTLEGSNTTANVGQGCWNLHNWIDLGPPLYGHTAPAGCATTGAINGPLVNNWHTYGAYWVPGSVTFYYDGQPVPVGNGQSIAQSSSGGPANPQFLVMDLIDRNPAFPAGNPTLSATMDVDWVRVWQSDSDSDGVPDNADGCIWAAGPSWHNGCPLTPPVVATGGAVPDSAALTTEMVYGTVTPGSESTIYHFDFGTTSAYGRETGNVNIGTGTSPVTAYASLSGLNPGQDYHFRVVATNASGTSVGVDHVFTAPELPRPIVTTGGAVPDSAALTTEMVYGTASPNGYSTIHHFEFGTTTAYGRETGNINIGSGTSPVPVSASLSGIVPDQAYHFRLVATNSFGVSYGVDHVFRAPDHSRDLANLVADPNHAGRYRWLDYANNGTGTFAAPTTLADNLPAAVQTLTLDVDQDGRQDVATLEPDPNHSGRFRWSWLRGTASGAYTTGGVLYDNLLQPLKAVVIDVDGDGKATDIAELESDQGTPGRYRWLWLKGNSTGVYTSPGALIFNIPAGVTQALATDVDGDGHMDIVEMEPDPAHSGYFQWRWLKGSSSGTFTVGGVLFDDLLGATQALSLDVDRDGLADIAEMESDPNHAGQYRWLWLKGNGTGASKYTVGGIAPDNLARPSVAVALDVDGDGRTDIAELEPDPANAGRYRWLWLQNPTTSVFATGGVIASNLGSAVQAVALPTR